MPLPPKKKNWICEPCQKVFKKATDKLMECEYCDKYFCLQCLKMEVEEYDHHIRSSGMWFCKGCVPKVQEVIKIEKEIEERCNLHYKKFNDRCEQIEKQVLEKCNKEDVEKIVDEKINKIVEEKVKTMDKDQTEVKKIVENVVIDIVDDKIAENEKDIADRQSREKSIILFNLSEPETNVITERNKTDSEAVNNILKELNMETEEPFQVDKVMRLGSKHSKPEDNPRPLKISFSTIESKRMLLKNASKLMTSNEDSYKALRIKNDLSKKDREIEYELLQEKFSKNEKETGNWRYVIRGPPGERKITKIRKK